MSDSDAFTLVSTSSHHQVFDDYLDINSGKVYNPHTYLQDALRRQYPELALTVTVRINVDLLQFAAAGNATAELDIKDESVQRVRYYLYPDPNTNTPGGLAESRTFAKYFYSWGGEFYIVYVVQVGLAGYQYILKEPAEGESTMSRNSSTDRLIDAIGRWQTPVPDDKFVWVYDGWWVRSKNLYEQVKTASWDDVILNEDMKKAITELVHKFYDNKDTYNHLGVPWKRGVIFHGPAGNGKTISIKALMNSLFERKGGTIPSLYVKHAPATFNIRQVFQQARFMAPCLLIFEDIDTVVTLKTRSYFFNEVDGLENNDGIFMVASTNHLDELDPGLSSRPSRFDRKYLFPLPSESERILYCSYWRSKLAKRNVTIEFPKKLCPAIASITDQFSFAYLQEAFVATLLIIAGNRSELVDGLGGGNGDGHDEDDDDDGLNKYELWREMKKQVKALRHDMDSRELATHGTAILERDTDGDTTAMGPAPGPTAMALPLRANENEAEKKLANPHLEGRTKAMDVDHLNAPLISDEGMFMDSRSISSVGVIPRQSDQERGFGAMR